MLRSFKKHILLGILIIIVLSFSGCTVIESIEKKLEFKKSK